MFAALGGTASADVFDDNPAAVSLGPGNVQLFARGPDGRILHRTLSAGTWSNWAPVEGLDAGSGPAAVVFGDSVYLFARSATRRRDLPERPPDGAWSGWVSLGGVATSSPAAATRKGNGVIDLFHRGVDNALWWRTLTPGSGLGGLVAGGREPQLGAGGVRVLEPGLGGRRHAQRVRRRHADLLVQRRVALPELAEQGRRRHRGPGVRVPGHRHPRPVHALVRQRRALPPSPRGRPRRCVAAGRPDAS